MEENIKKNNPPEETVEKPKKQKKIQRKTKIRGKKYLSKKKLVENKKYSLIEALKLLSETSFSKFDPSVELHFNLSIDPKKSDQNIRKIVNLKQGIKKKLKILAIGNEKQLKEAKDSGATYLGDEKILAKIKSGWTDFDKVIATPEMISKITPLAKILGPKGLMPNIKNNTITTKVKEAITNLISGTSVEIKNEKDFPIIHVLIGKLSFGTEKLKDNFKVIYESVLNAKPSKAKLPYIKSLTITTSMGPGIKLDLENLD